MTKSPKPTNSITLQSGSKIERYDVTPEQMAAICAAMDGMEQVKYSIGVYTMATILAACIEVCGFDFSKKHSQRGKYIIPRHTFCYLCRKHHASTYKGIADLLGKDHSTIIHAFGKVTDMLEVADPIYTAFVHQVENLLTIKKQTK
jgi:chromosomal replication initiation ATPase DnaA